MAGQALLKMNAGAEKTAAELAIIRLEKELSAARDELARGIGNPEATITFVRRTALAKKVVLALLVLAAVLWIPANSLAVALLVIAGLGVAGWIAIVGGAPRKSEKLVRVETLQYQLHEKRRIANS